MSEVEDLGDLITRHARTGVTGTAISGLYVMRSETLTDPLGVVARPSLAFVIGGAKIAWRAWTCRYPRPSAPPLSTSPFSPPVSTYVQSGSRHCCSRPGLRGCL